MQAVIRSGSKQYLVQPDQTLEIDLIAGDSKELTFGVLMIIDGDKIQVGTPEVDGITVKAEVVEEVKGDKIKVLKFRAKKREKRITGHRQRYTRIRITQIGSVKSSASKAAKPAPKKEAAKASA